MTPTILAAAFTALIAVDGDTIKDPTTGQRMRLAGIDAPERGHRADCVDEYRLAQRATDRLAALLPSARVEYLGRSDRYNRPLIRLRLPDGRTVGDALVSEGLAVPYDPRQRADWCG